MPRNESFSAAQLSSKPAKHRRGRPRRARPYNEPDRQCYGGRMQHALTTDKNNNKNIPMSESGVEPEAPRQQSCTLAWCHPEPLATGRAMQAASIIAGKIFRKLLTNPSEGPTSTSSGVPAKHQRTGISPARPLPARPRGADPRGPAREPSPAEPPGSARRHSQQQNAPNAKKSFTAPCPAPTMQRGLPARSTAGARAPEHRQTQHSAAPPPGADRDSQKEILRSRTEIQRLCSLHVLEILTR
jgi:hypothetical protein